MTSALVTGVAGFIGSHVAEQCLELGLEVAGLDNLSGGSIANIPRGVRFIEGSIADASVVDDIEQRFGRFDYIYHLAAYAAVGLSHFIRRFNYENNLIASVNLINMAIRTEIDCFVFASSISVYGAGQVPMSEAMTPRPEDPYGIAKYAVELDLAAAAKLFGLNSVILRPHNVYGEGQNIGDPYRNVIGIFMNQLLNGLPMTIFGDGSQTRAFTHVDDVAPLMARAPTVPAAVNHIFNIGAEQPYSLTTLAELVADALDLPCRIEYVPARQEPAHAVSDHARCHEVFGRQSSVTLPEGLERMAKWAQAQGPRHPVPMASVEVDRNMPPSWRALTEAALTEAAATT